MVTNEKQAHLKLMRNPSLWARWPLLPLKKRKEGSLSETGYLIETTAEHCYTVFLGNIFSPSPSTDPTVKYVSFEAILDDGWEVD